MSNIYVKLASLKISGGVIMFDQIIFGEKLKNHRKGLNLTQEEVGEKVGISGQAVSKWENGECLPDCYNLKLLSEVYGISLDILLETGKSNESTAVVDKIKQLATEFVWSKYSKDEKEQAHKELGDDLWMMWKAIYFVEIGNKDLQEREMKHANNRIIGDYGAKAWDDNGFACVIKSSLRNQLNSISDNELKILQTLTTDEYFKVLKHIDCHYPISKEQLILETEYDINKLNEILVYLTENKIVDFFTSLDKKSEGYKLTANRGIISYGILALAYLLTQYKHSTSEYLIK